MGRLIDADKLKVIEYTNEAETAISKDQAFKRGCQAVFRLIRSAPTVDAEPVRHGKWLNEFENEDGRWLRCSECRMRFWVGFGRDGNYCPNCGAKMDGEDNA